MTTEHTVVRSGKLKRKPFNSNVADYLLIIATFAFSYLLMPSDTSNICMCAFTVVAPGVRFNAFAIFLAPAFCFASHGCRTEHDNEKRFSSTHRHRQWSD